ncbi:MAG: ABC transporter ATP-binding protein [Gammaproteobacteria bacterium]|nr:ABC transporter ATP-binding protein [Gammaproteobacteria bacterium]
MQTHTHVIEINGLCFTWEKQKKPILDIPAFRVNRGERVFLQGPSGSGKSTLLSLLAGVSQPQSGSIKILGQELTTLSGAQRDHFRAHHIGFIYQMFNLIPYLSVIENVTLPCRFSSLRKQKALSQAGSPEEEAIRLLDHLEMAHDEVLHKPVNELSVGQQQRVAAARALIGSPEIIIADEPTSSLDADRRSTFIDLLFRECEVSGSTLVFVSHDRSLESPFDRTIDFKDINHAGDASLKNTDQVS